MTDLHLDISNILNFVSREEIGEFSEPLARHHEALLRKTGRGNDFLGWVDLPGNTAPALLQDIRNEAEKIRKTAEVYVVVGIGGSYLGARAVIEALSPAFRHPGDGHPWPLVVYAGQNLSEDYLADLLHLLDRQDYAFTVISKSGTTTEPAVAFRILKGHLEKKYGKPGARERIIAVTDKARGALKQLSDEEGYKTYVIPDDVGGRYSVLTPVGLLPVAAAGFDVEKLVQGAQAMQQFLTKDGSLDHNPAVLYAACRNALYAKGKTTEILVNYQPNLYYLTEWWKQLYGESEGKEHKGLFPAGVGFTTDLHSLGQYIQEGLRNLFETVIAVENEHKSLSVPHNDSNLDGLNFIAGKRIQEVNRMARLGTLLAHADGGVPVMTLTIPAVTEEVLGQLIYFYEFACALSGYTLGVNPFDQPGVEAYKKNMFALLGKPGYEKK